MPSAPTSPVRDDDAGARAPGHPVGGLLRRARRRVLLHRRWLAALLAALSVALVLRETTAPPEPQVRVWTASRDLDAGRVVDPADLAPVGWPPDAVPDGARTGVGGLVGRVLAAPVRRGEPLTDVRLLGGPPAGAPGQVAVPVRLGDAAVLDLLRPGERVDVAAADPSGRRPAAVLVRDARVLFVPRQRSRTVGSDLPGGLVLLAVPEADAARLADASVSLFLTPLWRD